MADYIEILLEVVEPIYLDLDPVEPVVIGSAQVGPQGLPGDASVPDASETVKGIIQLATSAEVETGTNTTKAVTPATLKPELDKKADNESQDLILLFENGLI